MSDKASGPLVCPRCQTEYPRGELCPTCYGWKVPPRRGAEAPREPGSVPDR
jgi:hypothetical protein